MKKKKYIFKKTHEIDKEKFAELLQRAKGGRTMKDFAELCGANPSTFTRIIQMANKGSSSTELLEAIAANAALKSGVTIEALADANGYSVEKDIGVKAFRLSAMGTNLETMVRNILVQELLDRKQEVRMGNIQYDFAKTMKLKPDALIMTDAFGKEKEIWFVDSIVYSWDVKTKPINKTSLKRMTFDRISRFSFISMNRNELFRPSRFSLVFFDKEVYDIVVEEFAEMAVPTYISLILMDTFNSTIADEVALPHFEKGAQVSYFMTTPVVDGDSDEEYLGNEEYDDEDYEGGI